MIVIIVDASGKVKYQSSVAIHQGSVDANKVMLVGPFPTAVITVAATLPNGKVYGYDLLKAKDEEKAEYALTSLGNLGGAYLDGSELFAYSYTLKGALTAKAGTLKLQFFINTSHFVEGGTESETFATNNVTVDVINGSGWLPSEPVVPDSIYTEIIKEFGALTTAVEGAKSASEDAKESADNAWNHANDAYNKAEAVDARESENFSNLNERLETVETFFDGAADDTLGEALNTLKEIQDYIGDHGEEASKLIEQVNTNKEDIAHLEGNVESMMRDLSDANERLEKVEETLEEGVGGVSSWNDLTDKPDFAKVATSGSYNDLTDKPFGSETVEGIITFDGDYSKYEYLDMGNDVMLVHVSDKVLTADEATGATIRYFYKKNEKSKEYITAADDLIDFNSQDSPFAGLGIFGLTIRYVIERDGGSKVGVDGIWSLGGDLSALQAAGLPITKEGTYFMVNVAEDGYYVESISCLTGSVETVKQIDKKYLPDTSEWDLVITAEMLKESSLNDLLADAKGRVFVKAIDDSTTINVPSPVKLIEFAPGVIFGSIVEIIGNDDIDQYYLDDCQVIKGANSRVDQSDIDDESFPTIRNFKGGVEHCHGTGWCIKDCNNVEHCTYLEMENCHNISHCNVGKGYNNGSGAISLTNCSNIEDLIITFDEMRYGWTFENCQFIRDIKSSHDLTFENCQFISNVVSTYYGTSFADCKIIRDILASDCKFTRCEYISNVAHNPSPNYGAKYENCKYVDPYTCVDFLDLSDIGSVQALTDDGTFSVVAI